MQLIVKLNAGEVRQALREFAARKSGVNVDRLYPTITLHKSKHVRSMADPVEQVVFVGVIS